MRRLLWVSLACLSVSVGAVTHLDGVYGTFESLNFPYPYANDISEEWQIQVRKGYKVKYKFTAFDLEDSYDADLGGACIYDYVKISEAGQQLLRFCGKARHHQDTPIINHWYHSKENNITVEFVTDYSNEGISPSGFAAHYAEEDIDECSRMEYLKSTTLDGWDELVTCNHFCINVPGSYYCDCRAGFELAPNKHTCVATFCENQKLTDLEGMVESPDYPYNYGKLSKCRWDINVPKGYSIHLRFDAPFDIEEHYEEGCVYDYLTINYKDHSEKYCGSVAPRANRTWDLNTRDVLIQFHTDMAVEGAGFRFHYNTSKIRCLTTLQAPTNGSITSVNSKGYYEFQDSITFACDLGFDMEGHHTTHCNNEGEWTHPVPKCNIISCGPPQNLTSVRYSTILDFANKTYEYLETLTLKCNEWYEQREGYAEWKCEHTKKWIPNPGAHLIGGGEIPICRPVCGIKGPEDTSLVVRQVSGGVKSEPHEWPWSVFLNFGRKNLDTNGAMCTGAVISPSHILTAAHCAFTPVGQRRLLINIHVWLGVPNRTVDESEVKYVQVAEVITHPFYNKISKWDFDVAIIKLNETIIMSDTIRPICLPSTSADFTMARAEQSGEVAAWGLFNAGFQTSMHLLHAVFPVVTSQHCLSSFQRKSQETGRTLPVGLLITDNMFCAGYEEGNKGTCQGDSGAPFVMSKMIATKNISIHYEMGLVSFGIEECGSTVSYTSFTKLNQAIVQWIMTTTNNLMED